MQQIRLTAIPTRFRDGFRASSEAFSFLGRFLCVFALPAL